MSPESRVELTFPRSRPCRRGEKQDEEETARQARFRFEGVADVLLRHNRTAPHQVGVTIVFQAVQGSRPPGPE